MWLLLMRPLDLALLEPYVDSLPIRGLLSAGCKAQERWRTCW